ncbi:MAG: CARDB domain-containing protein [bacterium]
MLLLFLAAESPAETLQYSYDSMQRLTGVRHDDGTAVEYVYDNLGNRLMKSTTLPSAPSNHPPNAATNLGPANGATNVATTGAVLSWSGGGDPDAGDNMVYFVHLGEDALAPLVGSGWATNYSPGRLKPRTLYYWQVNARDSHNTETPGPVWTFTTGGNPPTMDFSADRTNGWAPLTVSFRDRSVAEQGSIISWRWDFDGDGNTDSTARNPVWTYTNAGSFSVSLTAMDQYGLSGTVVRTGFVNVLDATIVDIQPENLGVTGAGPYRHLTVVYSVTNNGLVTINAPCQWYDSVYLSTNDVLDAADQQVGYFYENMMLPAGMQYSRTNVVTIPTLPAGNWNLILKADAGQQIGEINETNNTVLVAVPSLPDLVPVGLSNVDDAVSGEPLTIVRSTRNAGAMKIDGLWYDALYLSSNTVLDAGDAQVAVFYESGLLDPGAGCTRTNTVTLPQVQPGNYFLLLRSDDYDYVVESNEANNVASLPLTLTIADLAAAGIVAPDRAVAAHQIEVTCTVTNRGNGTASGYWYDQLVLSSNAVWDAQDYTLGQWYQSRSLTNGSSYSQTDTVTLPRWPMGTYYLLLKTDAYGYVFESDESNNVGAARAIVFEAPDLKPVEVSAPASAGAGGQIQVVCTVTNRGNGAALSQWYDQMFFSADEVIDTRDLLLGGPWLYQPVAAGATYCFTNTIQLPTELTSWIDVIPGNCLAPFTNGASTGSIRWDYWLGIPGASIADLTSNVNFPTHPDGGESLTSVQSPSDVGYRYGARVRGYLQPATSGVYRFWIAGDETAELWLSSDTNPGNKALIARVPARTGVREWTRYPEQRSAPVALTAGNRYYIEALHKEDDGSDHLAVGWKLERNDYYLIVRADAYDYVYEANETNNDLAVGIRLTQPDLKPVSLVSPTSAVPGQQIEVRYAVTNAGDGPVEGGWYDYIYLSRDTTWDASDYAVWSGWWNTNVAAGDVYGSTNMMTLPAWPDGVYYLIVKADVYGYIYEREEANNTSEALPIVLTLPDLAPVALTAPPGAEAGTQIEVSYTVTNQGSGAAGPPWYDYLYLSSNEVWDAGDFTLGEWYRGETLTNGHSYSVTNAVTLPTWPGGTYYIILKTDAYGYVFESNELNNESTAVAVSFRLPDLMPVNVDAPSSSEAGRPVQVVYAVTNRGNGMAAGYWYDQLVLSSNAVWDAQDYTLGQWYQGRSLTNGNNYSQTNTVTLPRWPMGTYYLLLRTDAYGYVFESDESNNVSAARAIVFEAPDLQPLEVSAPASAGAGHQIQVVCTVTNRGNGTAFPQWYNQVYFSADRVIDARDLPLGGRWLYASVVAGATYHFTNAIQLPTELTSWIDVIPGNCLAPFTNGASTGSIRWDYWLGIPGASVSDLTSNVNFPDRPDGGESLTSFQSPSDVGYRYGARVRGYLQPATSGVYRFWIAGDETAELWLSSDTNPDNKALIAHVPARTGVREWTRYPGQRSVPVALTAGSRYYIEALHKEDDGSDHLAVGWKLERNDYYLIVRVDGYDYVYEADETNNDLAVGIRLTQPDLKPISLVAPSSTVPGQQIEVRYAVTNAGDGPVEGSWYDYLYLSRDTTWDAGDYPVWGGSWNTNVAAGEVYGSTNMMTLPAWPEGVYYLILKTDANGYIYERDETNNTSAALPISLTLPDLAPLAVSAPAGAAAGTQIQVSCTVTNQGTGPAGPAWYDYLYLSSNEVWDAGDDALGGWYRNKALTNGHSYSVTNTVTLPQWPGGTYYIILRTDAYGYVFESNELNNKTLAAIVFDPPDLMPLGLSAPASADAGSQIEVVCLVTNRRFGGASAGRTDRLYLSTNNIRDMYDYLLSSSSQSEPIQEGQIWLWTNSVTLPEWSGGNCYLILVADADDDVVESCETNNASAAAAMVLTAADADGDGLPDRWETRHFGGPTNYSPEDDSDHDGMRNWQEYFADTNPTNADSVLQVFRVTPGAEGMGVAWQGGSDAWQILEAKQNLDATAEQWMVIFTNSPPTPATINYLHHPGTNRFFYYRIKAGR